MGGDQVMAGKKDKKSGEAKTEKKGFLPKSIAGMKLPKQLRKQLDALAKHPVVNDLLAAGLVALAAKLKPSDKTAEAKEVAPAPAPAPTPAAAAKPVVKRARHHPPHHAAQDDALILC
jgi:hypothetical protein